MRRWTLETLEFLYESKGCRLLATEYLNNRTPMPYTCKCGKENIKCLFNFQQCPDCDDCNAKKRKDKAESHIFRSAQFIEENRKRLSKPFQDVKKAFEAIGYELLDTEYRNCKQKLNCLCPKKHPCKLQYSTVSQGIGGCQPCRKEKIKATFQTKHGVDHYSQTQEYKDKMIKASMESYGVPHFAQAQEIHDKIMNSRFKRKTYTFSSGETIKYQGYENMAIDELLSEGCSVSDIIEGKKNLPEVWYSWEGKKCRYFPDLYIKSKSLIVEVKSEYTFKIEEEQTFHKAWACVHSGYNVEIRIYDKKGLRVKTYSNQN